MDVGKTSLRDWKGMWGFPKHRAPFTFGGLQGMLSPPPEMENRMEKNMEHERDTEIV